MYHSRAFPCVSKIKYRLWKRQLFSFSSTSRKPHTRFSRSKYGMLLLSHTTGTDRQTDGHIQSWGGGGEEEREQLILSSFSCDMIEAEQQSPQPEAGAEALHRSQQLQTALGICTHTRFHWPERRDGEEGGGDARWVH